MVIHAVRSHFRFVSMGDLNMIFQGIMRFFRSTGARGFCTVNQIESDFCH